MLTLFILSSLILCANGVEKKKLQTMSQHLNVLCLRNAYNMHYIEQQDDLPAFNRLAQQTLLHTDSNYQFCRRTFRCSLLFRWIVDTKKFIVCNEQSR